MTSTYLDLVDIVDGVVELDRRLLVVCAVLGRCRSSGLRRGLVHITRRVDRRKHLRYGGDRSLVSTALWHMIGRLVVVRRSRWGEALRDDNGSAHLGCCVS